jgi:2-polyprenyl-3-methyl-5-hydroxy-6-metoxy-1,4-benzoquinol methylase
MRVSDLDYPVCLCGAQAYKELLTTVDAGKTFKVIECAKCGLARSWPVPVTSEMNKQFYQSENDAQVRLDQLPLRRVFSRNTLRTIKKYKYSGRMIDVGCNVGVLVDMALKGGFDAFGVDLSSMDIQQGKDTFKLGERLIHGSLQDISNSAHHFDIVCYIHVFEHIPELKIELREIYKILNKGGILVIEVPNFDSFWRKLLGPRWYGLAFSQHIWQFTPKTLRKILEEEGYHCIEINTRHSLFRENTFDLKGLFKFMISVLAFLFGKGDNLTIVAVKND